MNLLYQYAYDGLCAKLQWKAAAGSIGFLYCNIAPTRDLPDRSRNRFQLMRKDGNER
jgi:hypothetical protein